MNALVDNFIGSNALSRDPYPLRVNVKHSGFSIASAPTSKFNLTFLAEVAFKLAGVLLIPVGGLILFLEALFAPQMVGEPFFWVRHVGLLAAFVFVGVSLHRWANKGFLQRVQVDTIREEIRIGTVNVAGKMQVLATYPVSQIESFFIIRSSDGGSPAKLQMRLKTGAKKVRIAEGTEKALLPILERILLTLKPPNMKNRRVQTNASGRFIRMSFG